MKQSQLRQLIREEIQNALGEGHNSNNYMFFENLKTLKHAVDEILAMNKETVDQILEDGHGWAVDHIATSTDDVEEVYHFLTNQDEIGHKDTTSHKAMSMTPVNEKKKKKKPFPDLNNDGEVTYADVLKGRGVKSKD